MSIEGDHTRPAKPQRASVPSRCVLLRGKGIREVLLCRKEIVRTGGNGKEGVREEGAKVWRCERWNSHNTSAGRR